MRQAESTIIVATLEVEHGATLLTLLLQSVALHCALFRSHVHITLTDSTIDKSTSLVPAVHLRQQSSTAHLLACALADTGSVQDILVSTSLGRLQAGALELRGSRGLSHFERVEGIADLLHGDIAVDALLARAALELLLLLLRFLRSSDALLTQGRLQPFELRGRHFVLVCVGVDLSRPAPLDLELFLESKSDRQNPGSREQPSRPTYFRPTIESLT